jgi:hypothetical protein
MSILQFLNDLAAIGGLWMSPVIMMDDRTNEEEGNMPKPWMDGCSYRRAVTQEQTMGLVIQMKPAARPTSLEML